MSIGLTRDREVAIRQFLLHHPRVVQQVLRASGVLYVRTHDPMVTLEAFAVADDEFDADAPSVTRPTREEPDAPDVSGIQTAVGHEVAELGVGTERPDGSCLFRPLRLLPHQVRKRVQRR